MFQTRPNIVISKLIKMLDDYGLHIASEIERDDFTVTVLTKNLAATIVKPSRQIKVLYVVKITIKLNGKTENQKSSKDMF